jgi:hypothetical protein
MTWLEKIAGAAVLFGLAGCTVSLAPKIPADFGGRQASGQLAASRTARYMPETVGHGRFTVFAIPVVPVKITNGPGDQLVMDSIRQTLRAAGYNVVDATQPKSAPFLECRVTKFDFNNYTWLFPIVPTWGSINMEIVLSDANGSLLWAHAYHGSSWNLSFSFNQAVNKAMAEVLDHFAKDATDPAFQKVCCAAAS